MYDVIVIGGGTAGLTCALYSVRNGKSVLVLEKENVGGQIAYSPKVENYPSIQQISGQDFADNLFNQVLSLGVALELETVERVIKNDKLFTVQTDYNTYTAKSIVIAVGVKHKHLPFERGGRLLDGVSYCAICDGAFYKGQDVSLVGDGNTALQYILLLANYCNRVTVFTLFDKFFGDTCLEKLVSARRNVEIKHNTCLLSYVGEDKLSGFTYRNQDGKVCTYNTDALFVAIGQVADNKIFADLVKLDQEGFIVAMEDCRTTCEGIFVAGDCRTKKIRQLTTATSDGAIAAMNACDYIEHLGQ
ncbi:MAG: FAD-dependent oxidoreductase [Clostridia bacterium]|nr:FAD-dependent oxidoreductase [Clostridia bacterium]